MVALAEMGIIQSLTYLVGGAMILFGQGESEMSARHPDEEGYCLLNLGLKRKVSLEK